MQEENANKKYYHMHHDLLNLEVIVVIVIVSRDIKLEGWIQISPAWHTMAFILFARRHRKNGVSCR